MKTISRLFVSSLFAGVVALASSTAHAESNRGAGYIQGEVLGYSLVGQSVDTPFGSVSASSGTFPLEIHGGYHLGGTHEGFVIGASQKFFFSSGFVAATVGRAHAPAVASPFPCDLCAKLEMGLAPSVAAWRAPDFEALAAGGGRGPA